MDAVTQDVASQALAGLFEFGEQSPFEACEQPLFHALQCHGRTVGGHDELASVLVKVVEDVEEGELCLLQAGKFLNVIDDEDIDALVEGDEVVDGVLAYAVCVLHLEEVCRDVEDAQLRVQFLEARADGVDEVRLADT